jgi:endonuclease I
MLVALVIADCAGCASQPRPGPGALQRDLDGLVVVQRPHDDGTYRRAAFGRAWADTDHNLCNQRDDALFAAVDKAKPFIVERQGSCGHDMIAGTWRDPYSGASMTFTDLKAPDQARAIQIDHVVGLGVAWRYGAKDWTAERRLEFATDLHNLEPASAATNESKSDYDPAGWRPQAAEQCPYATRYIQIKQAYALPVDRSEKQALQEMVDRC